MLIIKPLLSSIHNYFNILIISWSNKIVCRCVENSNKLSFFCCTISLSAYISFSKFYKHKFGYFCYLRINCHFAAHLKKTCLLSPPSRTLLHFISIFHFSTSIFLILLRPDYTIVDDSLGRGLNSRSSNLLSDRLTASPSCCLSIWYSNSIFIVKK